jgi:hypothetical protein
MKKLLISLITILIILSLCPIFSSGCHQVAENISKDIDLESKDNTIVPEDSSIMVSKDSGEVSNSENSNEIIEESNKISTGTNVNEKSVSPGDNEPANDGESQEQVSEETTGESSAQTSQNSWGELENAKIAFVCASVGAAWNIGQHFPQLDIKVYDEYQFDKGYRIQEILNSDKPDIMIIKECAAYFPPDLQGTSMEGYQNLIRGWINLVREQNVIPVLTTVVPIDPDNPSNLEGNRQLVSILEFNDWIKQYCNNENISFLDLEEALRVSNSDRTLDPKYDSGDGLHPNEIAYSEKLDKILIPALEKAIGYRISLTE